MKRYLEEFLKKDLGKKILFLSGPRQTGKTTLALTLAEKCEYLNWDNLDHREILIKRSWDRSAKVVLFDELHKMKKWKSWLKGIYDVEKGSHSFIVTGSAKLDTYRKVGDSLAGRFFPFRLHPLDIKEACEFGIGEKPEVVEQKLLNFSGFPEPFLEGSQAYYNRWKKTYLDIVLRQDLLDLEAVENISLVETLIQLLRSRVGSPLSYSSLARDLQVSDKTVRKWIGLLQELYVIFMLRPYHHNVARAIQKAPKVYFYDIAQVKSGDGAKFENLVACALLKEIEFRQDCVGDEWSLNYIRDRNENEIDFILCQGEAVKLLIEAKLSDSSPWPSFKVFGRQLQGCRCIQLVQNLEHERTYPFGLEIVRSSRWLRTMELDGGPAYH